MYDDTDANSGRTGHLNGDGDERLSTLFQESAAQVSPDVAGLVQGSIDRGRARRRHQSAGTALAVAAMAGVAVLAVSIGPGPGSGDAGFQPAGSVSSAPPSATSAPRKVTPTTSPSRVPKTAGIPVRAADLPGLFTRLHPGTITPAEARTGRIIDNGRKGPNAGQYAHFLWNGFQTTIGFSAYAGSPSHRCEELQHAELPPGSGPRLVITCKARPDGTVLMSWRDQGSRGLIGQSASLFTNDGYEIFAVSYNIASKTGRPLAAEPPFTMSQLTEAVTSDIWFR